MIGIDYKIDKLRAEFASSLFEAVEGNTYSSKGRAFINEKENVGKVPQTLNAGTNEYEWVQFDDRIDGISFMVVDDNVDPMDDSTSIDLYAKVDIYFAVNLKKLYPSVSERAVEYLHRDVIDLLGYTEFEFQSYEQGIEAFAEFDSIKPSDNMQPYYLVKFMTKIEFQINENYNC